MLLLGVVLVSFVFFFPAPTWFRADVRRAGTSRVVLFMLSEGGVVEDR